MHLTESDTVAKCFKLINIVKAKHIYLLKLKTIHKCFLCLYKRQNFHEHLRSHDAGKACHREGYITQTYYVTNTCISVDYPHCLA